MIKKITLIVVAIFLTYSSYGQTVVNVNNETELNTAINSATPGTTIVLANGTWPNIFIELDGLNGEAGSPITIEAQTPGLVLMTGNSRVYLEGSYLTVSGLVFQDAANLVLDGTTNIEPVIELKECDNCKVINNKIDSYNGTEAQKDLTFKWILTDGQFNEIAYNSFIGKYGVGSIINDNRNTSTSGAADYLEIHHNYFADRTPINGFNEDNDQDAIRIGNSATSLMDSFTEVYDNYFENFVGEIEVISNKSGSNKYYNNTFRNYSGALTLRHGDNCEVYNNFFFGENNNSASGIRVIGEGHKIYNNYIQDTNSRKLNADGSTSGSNATGGINISNGRVDTEINGYYQVIDVTIVNNTLVNCDKALRVGTNVGSDLTLAPENLVIANNIILNSSDSALEEETAPIGTSIYEGNITQNGSWDLTNDVNNNITVTSDLLTAGTDYYELTANSDAVNAGIGSYSFLTSDIFNGVRETAFDAGAEEYGASKDRSPYTSEDIGIALGFGATIVSEPKLETNPESIEFSLNASTANVTVISNIDWAISENISWLTIDTTSGSGTLEIIVSVDENTTEIERTATITLNEVGGDLSTTIDITQSDDTFVASEAVEIPVDIVTAVGTQTDDAGNIINGPENTTDGNTDTRWSASSSDGSAYLTFDLGCSHALTDVSIFFHKGTERTTTISIATSDDGVTFTDTYTEVESTLLTTEAYEDFEMNLISAQYIRIFGFGNSDPSPWNSIEEVKFFGDANCNDTLSTENNELQNDGITIYPIPVTDGVLNISSKNTAISNISVFNLTGQEVLATNTNGSLITEINTSGLVSGIYFIVINGTGVSKFIIK